MTRVALLDVNLLVALFDPDHVHHDAVHGWFEGARAGGWATCPLTENAVVRILSNAAYTGVHEPSASVRARLRDFCASGQHVFWPDDISVRDARLFAWPSGVTHRQLTDVYLLGLALHRRGRLATLDRGIPLAAVAGAGAHHLEVVRA